jgi:hypothetical protein
MPTQILAVNTTAADSSDVVVAAGTPLTVALKDADATTVPDGARVDILLKDDAGLYFRVDALTQAKPATVIVGAGTYRFSRAAGVSCGVFSG